ncbi:MULTISPECIES: PilZ domain-containing protein [unclassified Luteimonas]|uniref:PilZ domain-containing protein n=1 Tax=unclassified Luteimonas TaxID=2629088 RepID=UPI001602A5D5|nr:MULTISPECIES: PilZ domain-containing protein [unclassified Luteimonas]MBB1473680.1 PilZ domain-containing protein [Luteimonas sp. MC1782]MBB6600105.1 PilZ domain-containing protein [Luteimonas sp. MC1825]QOC87802.1 PilZ domain-containing protein [Luteimonas sp. MC1825]
MINEFRRAKRRKAPDTILVMDAMTERVVGRIGNLSETGMLLLANEALVDDALYQFRFALPTPEGADASVEVGAHLLWRDQASAPGQAWTGFRFIGMSEPQVGRLRAWIEAPGSHYE